ncbi:MAG: RHS repeat-associated core domain-containing protein [Chloroflexia bacterium]
MRENGTLYWLLTDHLGSTAITANGTSGAKVAEVRYKAWGEDRYTSGTTPTTYRYTGQRWEVGIGLYFYNARWYDPALGRFAQPDTATPGADNPQAFNRYSYSLNRPLNLVDPTGHWPGPWGNRHNWDPVLSSLSEVSLLYPSPMAGSVAAGSLPVPPPPTLTPTPSPTPLPGPCSGAEGPPLGQQRFGGKNLVLEGGINVLGGARGGEGGAFVAPKLEQHRFKVQPEATLTVFENGACISWNIDFLEGAGEFKALVSLATRENFWGSPASPSGSVWTEGPGPWYGEISVKVVYTGRPFGGIPLPLYGEWSRDINLMYPPPTPYPSCTVPLPQ